MSTWHQDQACPVIPPLSWSICTDPPNKARTWMGGFHSREDAQARIDLWARSEHSQAREQARHSYVVQPS